MKRFASAVLTLLLLSPAPAIAQEESSGPEPTPSETFLMETIEREKAAERTDRNRSTLLTSSLITGGLSLAALNLSFLFADAAFGRYITAEDPRIGGYYQEMWQSLEAAGLFSGALALVSVLCASGCLAALDTPGITGTRAFYEPSGALKLMEDSERLAAVEEEILRTAEALERAETGWKQNTLAAKSFVTLGLVSFLASGVNRYLAAEASHRSDTGAFATYSSVADYTALGGSACFSLSLLFQTGRSKRDDLRRTLTGLEVYRRSLNRESGSISK